MHGSNGSSFLATRQGIRPRGPRLHPALIPTAIALLACLGVAGCAGHAAPATGSTPGAPSPTGAARSSAAAPAPLAWSAARAPLPADANGVSGQYASLGDVTCAAVGNCVAVGFDKAKGPTGDVTQGLVETLSGGKWTAAAVPGVSSQKGVATLNAVSCPAPGNCVAVGFVSSGAGAVLTPVILTLSGGRWSPVKPPLPSDAITTASATLNDVSCPAAGACVATGWYSNQVGRHDGYMDTLAHGTWTAASAALPADAAPEQYSATAGTYLAAVACTGVGACVAPGQYRDAQGQTRALIDTLSGGTWTASPAPLPADAATTGQVAGLWAVSCAASGTCVAAGHYIQRGGQPRFLTETLAGGAWTAAALSLPADAAADQKWSQYQSTTIGGLACEPDGSCVATAGYVTKESTLAPLIETLSGGRWTAAKAPLPADAVTSTPQDQAYLDLATCPANGDCLTVGSYPAVDGSVEGVIEVGVPRTVEP